MIKTKTFNCRSLDTADIADINWSGQIGFIVDTELSQVAAWPSLAGFGSKSAIISV